MFKAAKRRFVRQYLISMSLIVLIAFILVFITNYNNQLRLINNSLELQRMDFENGFGQIPEPVNEVLFTDEQVPDDEQFGQLGHIVFLSDGTYFTNLNLTDEEIVNLDLYRQEENKYFQYDGNFYAQNTSDGVSKVILINNQVKSIVTSLISLIIIYCIFLIVAFLIARKMAEISIKPLEENNKVQLEFINDVNHEIKTPLAVISTNLQVMKHEKKLDLELINYSIDETKRMSNLTQNLLFLNKQENETKVKTEELELDKLISLILSSYEVKSYEKGISLTADLKSLKSTINRDYFTQLLQIYLDNAFKYVNKNKLISVKLQKEQRKPVLTITNSANPITDNELAHLSDRFFQVDKSRTDSGFGLGLSIAQKIALLNNYDIHYQYFSDTFIVKVILH